MKNTLLYKYLLFLTVVIFTHLPLFIQVPIPFFAMDTYGYFWAALEASRGALPLAFPVVEFPLGNTSQRAAPCLNLDELNAHSNLNNQKVEELINKNELFTLKNNHRYKTSPSIAPCKSKNMENFSILATAN